MPRARITHVRPAGDAARVLTLEGGNGSVRKEPCPNCPWRVDATGVFPAEAFRHSAETAYDMARETFGCHSSGARKPAMCAGFVLRGAGHNLAVRLRQMGGESFNQVHDGGHALHNDYVDMAVANGVDPADPVLAPCRRRSHKE